MKPRCRISLSQSACRSSTVTHTSLCRWGELPADLSHSKSGFSPLNRTVKAPDNELLFDASFSCIFIALMSLLSPISTQRAELKRLCSLAGGIEHPEIVNAVVTNTIRLRFDARSTNYQRSLRSQWRNITGRWPASRSHADLSASVQQHTHRKTYGRNVGRRMVVVRSNCGRMGVERR